MKKLIIAALVGGLILFIWQFLSWAMLNLHAAEYQYTADQDEILELLSDKLEDGSYFLPTVPPESPSSASQEMMENNIGKPWAQIHYHSALTNNMGLNMARGLVANILAALILAWFLMKISNNDMKTTVLISIGVGIIGYLTIHYSEAIWFETGNMADLIDSVVQWALCGAWLGWWLNRGKMETNYVNG